MIKLIIFDLDGVLVEAKQIHYETLNQALKEIGEEYVISETEHLSIYDGLKTTKKLELLTKNKGLNPEFYENIWGRKQELTIEAISQLKTDDRLIQIFKELRSKGYKLACCSNSIRRSVLIMLSKIGVIEYMDIVFSNEDVKNSKPHPEIYWKAISAIGVTPEETLIIEDSPPGLLAASRSNANVLRVKNSFDLSINKIYSKINNINTQKNTSIPKWTDENLNILIPMAGAGSRFELAGYKNPKPLIDVNGDPMIKVVVNNINIDANYIFVVQKKHNEKYNLDMVLNLINSNSKIIEIDSLTEGAACTALLAKEHINNDNPLFFANSDQYVNWNSNEFLYKMNESDVDGGIAVFNSNHPKWSYAKLNEQGYVIEVAEKNPISDLATVGFYYWKRGSDFVKYAEQMINKNIRVNNEFYVCPVFNQAIEDGKKIIIYHVDEMFGLGTPEDLELFLKK